MVSYGENGHNRKGLNKNNTSGYNGVSEKNGRFRAAFNFNYKTYNLGYFDTPEEANQAIITKKKEVL